MHSHILHIAFLHNGIICRHYPASGTWEYLEAATPSGSPSFAAPLHLVEGGASSAHSCTTASNGASVLGRPPLSNGVAHAAAAAAHEQALVAGAPVGSGACSAACAGGEARAMGHGDELLADEVLDDSSAASEGAGSASGDPEQGAGPWARFQEASEIGGAGPVEPSRPSEAPASQAAGPALQGRGCSREEGRTAGDAAEQSAGGDSMASPAGDGAEPGLGSVPQRLGASGEQPSHSAAEAGACGRREVQEASEAAAIRGTTCEARELQAPADRAGSSGAAGSGRGASGGSGAQTPDPSGSDGAGSAGGAGVPEQLGVLSQASGAAGSCRSGRGAPDCSEGGGGGADSSAECGRMVGRQGLLSEGSGGSDAGGAVPGGGGLLAAVQRAAEKEYRVRRAPAVLAVRTLLVSQRPPFRCWLPERLSHVALNNPTTHLNLCKQLRGA